MKIFKDALPSGLSYALKPSLLENSLKAGAIKIETCLYQRRSGWVEESLVLSADFYPAGRYYKNQDEILIITSRAVPSFVSVSARAFIEGAAVPELIEWARELERLPVGSTVRREKQSFARQWTAPSDGAA